MKSIIKNPDLTARNVYFLFFYTWHSRAKLFCVLQFSTDK